MVRTQQHLRWLWLTNQAIVTSLHDRGQNSCLPRLMELDLTTDTQEIQPAYFILPGNKLMEISLA